MELHPPTPGYTAGPDGTMSVILGCWTGQPPPGSTVGQQAPWQYTSGIKYDSRNGLGLPTLVGVPAPPPIPGQHQSYRAVRSPWQDKLQEACRSRGIDAPLFQIVSERRGGRTAWSSSVTVYRRRFSARYWYHGNYLNNANEDAAEVALKWLNSSWV